MKRITYLLFLLLFFIKLKSQLSGSLNVPLNYTSVASVISAINQQGVSGALTVNVAANYTETVPYGGYSLTASGSAASPVVFRKSGAGANPVLTSYAGGTGTPGSMNQDGIWRLIGCDFITIDGIDIMDINTSNPSTMEFGYGLFKANGNDGCQNNTIKNCVITLSRINNAGGTGPASDGSRGIDVINASANVHNAAISVSSSSGSNSNNKFYSNTIQNCNTGISLIGFADTFPFTLADRGNDLGGNSISTGNTIIDFGGGGSANTSAAIRTLSQYDLNVSYNVINNNTGQGIDHPVILRGIQLNAATSANVSITNNTLTLHGGGTSSQLSVIENSSGSTAYSNTVSITDNLIQNCTYATSVSGPFYGIWNTASPDQLMINNNSFVNNSTSASGGSTYLIYNNGAVGSSISMNNNTLGFNYNGTAAYGGNMYNIYNANGTPATTLTIQNNNFSNYNHLGFTGTGNLYFIYNTNDSYNTTISNNSWTSISLNHNAAQYLINNNSSTQSLLSVNGNSIIGSFNRMASAGATYLYYSTSSSPSTCVQTLSGNNFSNITATVSGTGNFYGIYNTDGTGSSYPKKVVSNNIISNVNINSSGIFYGYFFDNLGEGINSSGSVINNNTLTAISRAGVVYGMYISGNVSSVSSPQVHSNLVQNLSSSGASSALYSTYLAGGGLGLNFYKNKISTAVETGTSGLAHGIYVASAINTTLANNFIGHIHAPNSSATNAVNGIYINGGSLVNIFYNSIYLNAISNGGNFNSNALYCSATVSLNLRNNILVNLSSGGTGIATAFRRSSASQTNYLTTSNANLFYAGTPGPTNILLQNGSTAYQTLSVCQTAVSPRESNSVSQNINFLSTSPASANYLRITPNITSPVESGASNITGLIEDYDSQIRQGNPGYSGSGSAPDIGADEYDQNTTPCSSANAGTIFPAPYSLCEGQGVTLLSNGFTPGVGLTHQWKVASNSGGPYSNVVGGNGSATPEFISAPLNPGTYYFVLTTTCSLGPVSAASAEATVVVNPIPAVSVSVSSSLVCVGQTINLIGYTSTGTIYQWSGPNGFNSVNQNPNLPDATPNASGVYYFSTIANGCVSPQASVAVSVSDVTLSASATSTGLCLGNTSTLSLNTSGITYTWSNGSNSTSIVVSPSVNTVYSVTATNFANCSVSKNVTISVINPSIAATNTFVCGSSATVNLSVNAFTPSLINWYGSTTSTISLGSGTIHSANITSTTVFYAEATNTLSGCQSLRIPVTVTLSSYPILTVAASPSSVCPGKPSTLTVSGATSYSWISIGSGSIHAVSPLTNHVYTVTGKSSFSCSSTETVLVTTHTVATISVIQTGTSACPSSVVGFTASGANSYYWNTGANGPVTTVTPAINSTYTVYGVNSQSCVSTTTMAVTTKSVPVISILQSGTTVCPGESVTFTASGASSYTWLPGNTTSHTFSVNPVVSAIYNAIGKSINTCTNVAFAYVSVDPCAGLNENKENEQSILIFPNPSSDLIYIKFKTYVPRTIRIFSALSLLVFEKDSDNAGEIIDVRFLPRGIYFLEMESGGKIITRKLVLY